MMESATTSTNAAPVSYQGLDPSRLANEVVRDTIYIRNNLVPDDCFAWMYYGLQGGPAMRTIDCRKIPPHLLITTNVPMPEP